MEADALFWSQLSSATASFCHELLLEDDSHRELLEAVAGEDWEWMGSSALMHLSSRAISTGLACEALQAKCDRLKTLLERQTEQNKMLKKKVSEMKSSMHDREWQLQEKIAALQQSAASPQFAHSIPEPNDNVHQPHVVTPERDSQWKQGPHDQLANASVHKPTATPDASVTPSLTNNTSRLGSWFEFGDTHVIQTQPKRRDCASPPHDYDSSYLDVSQIITPALRQRNTR